MSQYTSARTLRLCMNFLLVALIIFQPFVIPLTVSAATVTPAIPVDDTPEISLAEAEAEFYAALNAMINIPADAPVALHEAGQQRLEAAALQYQQVSARISTESAAPADAAAADGAYVYASDTANEQGETASWMVLSKPAGDRDIFSNAFSEQMGGDAAEPSPATTVDIGVEQSTLPVIYSTDSTRSNPNPDEVILFDAGNYDTNFGYGPVVVGNWPDITLTIPKPACNDCISSIRVGDHVNVTIYDGGNFTSTSAFYTDDVPLVAFNDQMSSLKVTWKTCPAPAANQVVVYSYYYFAGQCQTLNVGGYDYTGFSFRDDTVSSVVLGSDVVVDYYDNADFTGFLNRIFSSVDDLTVDDDRISSLRVSLKTDFSVVAVAPPPSLSVGGDFTLDYHVTNANVGSTDPTLTFQLTLPADVTYTGSTCSLAGSILTCTQTNVGASTDFAIPLSVSASATTGPRTFNATVSGLYDANTANNTTSNIFSVSSNADLATTVTGPAFVYKNSTGDSIYTATITVINNGPAPSSTNSLALSATNGTITTITPSQGTCTGTTCALGAMANSASATITAQVTVSPAAVENSVVSVTAISTASDPTATDNVTGNNNSTLNTTLTFWDLGIGSVGPGGNVFALTQIGGSIYAAGSFGVKRWTGSSWVSVGTGGPTGTVYALISDGASGFYVGGDFTLGSGEKNVARWNGSAWVPVASGINNGTVYALTRDSDGHLYVGGQFTLTLTAGTANNIVRWNGTEWLMLGTSGATGGTNPHVRALVADGTTIYAGGVFTSPAKNIARWDKASNTWFALDRGVLSTTETTVVHAMLLHDGRLYVGGNFTETSYVGINSIKVWDIGAQTWFALGSGMGPTPTKVNALAVNAGEILVGGTFTQAGGVSMPRVARWNGASWSNVSGGVTNGSVDALLATTDPTHVFMGGSFTIVNTSVSSKNVAHYTEATRNLALTQSLNPPDPIAGQALNLTYQVSNPGSVVAASSTLRVELPPDYTYTSATSSQGTCSYAVGVLTCSLGNLNVGATATITVQGSITPVLTKPFKIRAWAGSSKPDADTSNNRIFSEPPVQVNADLVTSLNGPTDLIAGQPLAYTLDVRNDGPALAQAAQVTFTIPAGGALFQNATGISCSAIRNYADSIELQCLLGDLPTGAQVSGTLNFSSMSDALGTLSATASATSLTTDPTPADASVTLNTALTASSDLNLSLYGPQRIFTGTGSVGEYSYDLTLSNQGPSLARNAAVSLTLPAATTFVSASPGCIQSGQVVTCSAGDLDAAETATFVVRAYVNVGTTHGTNLTANASATSASTDPVAANNSASTTLQTTTNPADNVADFQLSMQPPTVALAGESAVFRLILANAGAVTASGNITVNIPSGTLFDPSLSASGCAELVADPMTVICKVTNLTVGERRTLDFAVSVNATTPSGTLLLNSASVSTSITDPNTSNNSATASVNVTTQADLRLNVESSLAVASAGESVTLTVTVTNRGPSQARDLVITNPQPAGMVLQSATSGLATCGVAAGTATCTLSALNPGATATITLVLVAGSGEVTSTTTLTSSTPDLNLSNNTGSVAISIAAAERVTQNVGSMTITADAFIDLGGGRVQAFGDVWLGEFLHLAGATDSLIIEGTDLSGSGTLEFIQEKQPVFTGTFTGSADTANLTPQAGAQMQLGEIGGFAMASLNIDAINLLNGQVNGTTDTLAVESEGFAQTLSASFFVAPGLTYGGTVENFTVTISDIQLEVAGATITNAGVEAASVTLTLPPEWGGITTTANDLVITEDRFSIGGASAKIPLPDFNLSGEEVRMTENSVEVMYDGADLMFVGNGTLQINLPDNAQSNKISFRISTSGDFAATIDQMTLSIASASLQLEDIAINNSGLFIGSGVLTLPPSLNESTVTLTNITINDSGLRIGSGSVQIKLSDINVGDGSKVRFSNVVVTLQASGSTYTFGVSAVLQLRLPQNIQDITVTAQIDTDGNFSGNLSQITLNIASATLTLNNIDFDAQGLRVGTASIAFPPSLGGITGTLGDVRIDAGGLSVGSGGLKFDIPDFRLGSTSGFMVTQAKAEITFAADRTYKLTLSGTVSVDVKSVKAMVKGSFSVDSRGYMSGKLEAFEVNIAGLGVKIRDVQFTKDTLLVAEASMSTPASWGGASVSIYNLRISPSGVSIGGGKFKIPEIRVGSLTMGGLEGSLIEEGNGYVISFFGRFGMAGLGSSSCSIGVGATMYVATNGSTVMELTASEDLPISADASLDGISGFELRQVKAGLLGCRIPLASTGFYLTRVEGQLTLTSGQTVIDLGVTIANDGEVVRGDADFRLQFNPWKIDLTGSITLFSIFKAAEMKATVASGYFSADLRVRQIWPPLEGNLSVTAWTTDGSFSLIGRATLDLVVREGSLWQECVLGICISIPPFDFNFAQIGTEFGKFRSGSSSVWGLKGWLTFLKMTFGFYFDQTGDFSVTNLDSYQLVTPPSMAAAAAAQLNTLNAVGSPPPVLNAYEISGNDYISRHVVTEPSDLMFVISRRQAAPILSLISPSGQVITTTNRPNNVAFQESPLDGGVQTIFMVSDAEVGSWQAVLGGAVNADNFIFQVIGANPPPVVEAVSVVSTGTTSAELTWKLTSDEPETALDVYITPGPITTTHTLVDEVTGATRTIEQDFFSGGLLVGSVSTSLDGTTSHTTLDLSGLKSGTYWVWVNAEDGRNPPTRAYAPMPLVITRPWADSWDSNLIINPIYRGFDLSWAKSPNPDADFYRIELGREPGVVDRTYELGDQRSTLIDNLTPGQIYYLTVVGVNSETGRTTYSQTTSAIAQGAPIDLTTTAADQTLIASQSVVVPLSVQSAVDPYPATAFMLPGDLPDGVAVSFDTEQVVPTPSGVAVQATISTTASMREGIYSFPIRVQSEGMQDEVTINLTVHEPRVDVSADPTSVTLSSVGGTASVTLNAQGFYGATGPLDLDLLDVPPGLLFDITGGDLSAGGSVTLNFTDTNFLQNGTYTLRLRSELGLQQQYIPITLVVNKPAFTLNPQITTMAMLRGEKAVFAIPVTGENLSQAVSFDLLPETSIPTEGRVGFGASPSRSPLSTIAVTAPNTTYLIFDTTENTTPGTYQVLVRAQAHGRAEIRTFEVVVLAEATGVDLEVLQQAPSTVVAGGTATYTLRVTNYGPLTADQVVLTDTLPAAMTARSVETERGTCQMNAGTVVCNLTSIRRGTSVTVKVEGVLQPDVPSGTALVNRAEVTALQSDLKPGDNVNLHNHISQTQADLIASISASTPEAVAGGSVTYTIVAWNKGLSNAPGTQVITEIPPEFTMGSINTNQGSCYRSLDGRVLTCDVGMLDVGTEKQIATIWVSGTVSSSASSPFNLQSRVLNSTVGENNQTDNSVAVTTRIRSNVDLEVSYSAVAPAVAIAGDEQTYQLLVRNLGISDAPGVVLTNQLPEQFTRLNEISTTQGSCAVQDKTATCNIGTLVPQGSVVITVRGVVNSQAQGSLQSIVSVSTAVSEVQLLNNLSTQEIAITQRTDLLVTATTPTTHMIQYSVVNDGPSQAGGVRLRAPIPSAMVVESAVTSHGSCQISASEVVCDIGTLQSKERAVITLQVDYNDGNLEASMTATVSGNQVDPRSENNSARADVSLVRSMVYLPVVIR